MGWDAESSLIVVYGVRSRHIKNRRINKLFKGAFKNIQQIAGTADGSLDIGSLDCSTTRKMLEQATDQSAYTYEGWNVEFVKELNAKANWNFKYPKKDLWAYLSAKAFLEICAQENLSIKFTW
jgi:hypothetical protein